MHTSKARLAAIITALASLTFVGAALAQEPDDPELAEEETPVECVEGTTDDADDDATDAPAEGTVEDEATEDDVDTAAADEAAGADETVAEDPCQDETEAPEGDEVTPELEDAVEEQADDVAPAVEGEWESHGAYVSEQARVGCWEAIEEYANHGECVREAAHSDIGKPAKGDAVEDEPEALEATDDADDGGAAPAPKTKGASGKGRGKR